MKLRKFGSLGIDVPVVGLGTWMMDRDDRERAILAIHRAIDLGMTHIDTAEFYGKGAVEELVGEALAGHRASVFLASKVIPSQATYAGTLRACEMSLRRLRTDHLDLYMLHWPGDQPLAETLRALETLKEDGKIRAWGLSNFDVTDLENALEIVGEGAIACNQVHYNREERDTEHVLQTFCERHHIAFVGYSPFGSGNFPSPKSDGGRVLARIAAAHAASPRAVALAYLTRSSSTFTIPKASRAAHIDELSKASDIVLSAPDLEAIEAAFPLPPPKSKLPMI